MSLVSKINALAQGIAADIKVLAAGTGIALLAGGGLASNASGLQLDTAVAVRKVTKTIGDGAATSITVLHSLGTRLVTVSVLDVTTFQAYEVDWSATDKDNVTFIFSSAPAAGSLIVVIHG